MKEAAFGLLTKDVQLKCILDFRYIDVHSFIEAAMIVGPVQVQVGGQQWQWYCWQTSVDQYRNIVDILVLNQLVFCAATIIQTFVFLKCQEQHY